MKSGRNYAIDLGRGSSVVMMVLVHTLWMYGSPDTQEESWFGQLVQFIGKGTPMFLLAMGFSFFMSSRQRPIDSVIRGIKILIVGYAMNALKFIVPIEVFGTMPESFIAAYGWTTPLNGEQLMYLLATGDILQFAGLALCFMGVIQRFITSRFVLMALAFAVAGLSGVLQGYRPGIPYVDGFADLLWGQEWNVYFPVVPWASVVLFGMFIGMHYRQVDEDPEPVFRAMIPIGLVLAITGGVLCTYWPEVHLRDFFHLGPGGAIHLMGVSALLYSLAHVLQDYFRHTWLGRFLSYCSKHVTSLYVIHWVLICWGMGLVGFRELGPLAVAGLAPVILALTVALDALIRKVLSFSQKSHGLDRATASP